MNKVNSVTEISIYIKTINDNAKQVESKYATYLHNINTSSS